MHPYCQVTSAANLGIDLTIEPADSWDIQISSAVSSRDWLRRLWILLSNDEEVITNRIAISHPLYLAPCPTVPKAHESFVCIVLTRPTCKRRMDAYASASLKFPSFSSFLALSLPIFLFVVSSKSMLSHHGQASSKNSNG